MRSFHKAAAGAPGRALIPGAKPKKREDSQGKPGTIVLSTNSASGTCLNCPDTPCVYFREDEIVSPVLTTFPFNRTREVCPFGAIVADTANFLPVINDQMCIGCGLCVSRCPSNALYANTKGTVSLNNTDNDAFKTRAAPDPASHADTVARLEAAPKTGTIRPLEEDALASVMKRIAAATLNNTNQKLLARNLLICLGAKAAISSVGDTNVRLDMWWESGGVLWVTEVDYNEISLIDSPRNLLDDFAVCVSRHGIKREKIGVMIINVEFPNKRSDYYHLIEDVKKITNIEIRTLPIAALLLALWSHKDIKAIDISKCNATRGHEDTSASVKGFVTDHDILSSRYFCATK